MDDTGITTEELRIFRRVVGERPAFTKIVAKCKLRVSGDHGFCTTPSGRTIVHYPNAYGWRILRHPSTRTLEIGRKTLAVLRKKIADKRIVYEACLSSDAFAIRDARGVVVRYMLNPLRRAGVAIRMPSHLRSEFGAWEHGKTQRECRAEIQHKRAIVAERAALAVQTAREARKARLLARVATTLTAQYSDARACGYCDAGIQSWCSERGIPLDSQIAIATLARDSDRRAQAVALLVARRALVRTAEQKAA